MIFRRDVNKWCDNLFTVHKTTTEYCSHRCANLAYKDKIRKQRIESYNQEIGKSIRLPSRPDKEFLTPTEVSILLGVGRTSIYRYIKTGKIKVIRLNRKTLIRRTNIENMSDYIDMNEATKETKEKSPITDSTPPTKSKRNTISMNHEYLLLPRSIIFHVLSSVARPIGARNILPTLQRKLRIPTLSNGTAHRRCKINLV